MKGTHCFMACLVVLFVVVWTGCGDDDAPAERKIVLTNHQPAALVLGKPDFVTGGLPPASRMTVGQVYGLCMAGERLLLAGGSYNRIGYYNSMPLSNFQPLDGVLGQADFTSSLTNRGGAASGNLTLNRPKSVYSDGTRFVVADSANHRILLYNNLPTAYDAPADRVVGQSDFTTTALVYATESSLAYPKAAILSAGRLIVADTENHRVLVWNSLPAVDGAPADLVLGQNSFTACFYNDDDQDEFSDTTCSARTFNSPSAVWSDGRMLIVSDFYNNRVLIWKSFPTTDFQPADVVVGQASMTNQEEGCTASRLHYPSGIAVHAGQLFIADEYNDRVLVWNMIPDANGTPADVVLGQPDFVTSDSGGGGCSAQSLYNPSSILVVGDKVLVADSGCSRILVYQSQQ